MNTILFVFITLCTVFLTSSVSNLIMTINALDYFAERSELSDYFIFASDDELTEWLTEQENVIRFEINPLINLTDGRILIGDSTNELVARGAGSNTWFFSKLPQELNLPLDVHNNPLKPLETGEIAISFREASDYDIEIGDKLYLEIDNVTHPFLVTEFVKDTIPFPRLFISDDDFAQISQYLNVNLYTYAVDVDHFPAFTNALNRAMFENIGFNITDDIFRFRFTIDLMAMTVFVIVGICLIAISLIVLRFAILFTLQEDYKEIGIMKAIGIKNKQIQKIYLIKYLFLASLGAGLGFILSYPFGELLMGEVRENIAFPNENSIIFIRLLSTVLIVLFILSFCFLSTRKLNKFTAMQAIRSGETGERFNRKSFISLHKMSAMPTVGYLVLNDLLSQAKSYLSLLIVFTLGFLLVAVPLNINNTIVPEKMAELMQKQITDVYFDDLPFETNPFDGTPADLKAELTAMEAFYDNYGLEINIQALIVFSGIFYTESIYESIHVAFISQNIVKETAAELQMLRGVAPVIANEIALTETVLERLEADIGDDVFLSIDGVSQRFLITGSYQSLNNMGVNAQLSQQATLHNDANFDIFYVQGDFINRNDIAGQIQQLEEISGESTLITLADWMERMLIDTSIIDPIILMILVVVSLVNGLIITLMNLSFIMRDIKQIALIKNLGFSNQAVKRWQSLRILVVMMVSLALGMLLMPLANGLANIPFGMMGAPEIELSVNAMQIYFLYPFIFIVVTALTLSITTLGIKKIGIRDMGNTD